MKLKDLIKNLSYDRIENISDCEIKGITCDSRKIGPGYLFVAINGGQLDGHHFINQALGRGAVAVIAQEDRPVKKTAAKILVQDSRNALAYISATFFDHPANKLKVIGITGTNGKTSVSYLIRNILASAEESSGLIGTINYSIGDNTYPAPSTSPGADILQSFLQEIVLAQSKYAIIEVSSHALVQHRVDYIDFTQAIFTNLSPEHLDYHKSLKRYFSAKASLFERLNASDTAIVNLDDRYGRGLTKKIKSKLLTFGIEQTAQIQAKNIKLDINKSCFTIVTSRGEIEIESSLIGKHNVYNILAAVASAFVENIDFSDIASGVKSLRTVPGRLERIDCGQDFLLFIDYAHTDDALKKVLQTLCKRAKHRIIVVFGCGGDRDKAKRARMGKVATDLAGLTIITSDNPRSEDPQEIIADIIKGIAKKKNNYRVVLDRFQAIEQALAEASRQDIVLLAGKGHESAQIFAKKKVHFNDREAVEKILKC